MNRCIWEIRNKRLRLWDISQEGTCILFPLSSQSKIMDTRLPSCRAVAGVIKCHAQCEWKPAFGGTLSQEPLVLITNSLDALLCVLIQGTLHWQQVFAQFDKCQLLNIHFGERRVTDTTLPLLNWWPFHSVCWRTEAYTCYSHMVGAGPASLPLSV